jgi:predicted dehydrogenase
VIRFGVIGVGWAGRQHIAACRQLPGAEVTAIAGLEEPVRTKLAAEYGIERHVARWEDLLELDGLDAVTVAVPTFLHAPITIAALERGLHVLCEKPMARNEAEASAMVGAARAAGRVLDVAFNHRQRGDILKLRELIAAGELGRPYYAKGWWLRRTGIPRLGSWFVTAELAGGGPLVDIGVHVLDYAMYLLGSPRVTAVSASTYDLLGGAGFGFSPDSTKTGDGGDGSFDVEDLATVFLRLEGGGTLLLETSWAAHRADGDQFGITLYGTDGGAELIVDDYEPVGKLRFYADQDGVAAEKRLTSQPGRGHVAVVEQFLEKVGSGDWAAHDGSSAVTLARIVDASYRSAAEQREIRLDGVE